MTNASHLITLWLQVTKEVEKLTGKRDKLNASVMALAQAGQDFDELERLSLELGKVVDRLDGPGG